MARPPNKRGGGEGTGLPVLRAGEPRSSWHWGLAWCTLGGAPEELSQAPPLLLKAEPGPLPHLIQWPTDEARQFIRPNTSEHKCFASDGSNVCVTGQILSRS